MQDAKKVDEFMSSADVIDITEATRSLNQQYYSEKENIIKEFGTLEDMRLKLGLTKSQAAKLLLVKPATWSRWEKNNEKAPPHIFQAMKWYMLLAEAKPEIRTQAAPEFLYENQLKMIGSELRKIKSDTGFKAELMNVFEDKISSVLNQGLSQIQVQIQPVVNHLPVIQNTPQVVHLDESYKVDQFKLQTKVENVEYLIRQMREDLSHMKFKEQGPQTISHTAVAKKFEEQSSKEVKILAMVLGTLAVGAISAMAYMFIMYY